MKRLLTLSLMCCAMLGFAQQPPTIKYGKISPADLEKKVYEIDAHANAVVISDIGSAEIVGNSKGWFSLVFRHHKRVHILNKSGYHHADVEVPIYSDGTNEVELENLKAVTYNLENGKVVESKLDKSAVFKEKIDKNYSRKKFTLPNVKEGSTIEYEYKVTSDFLRYLRPWAFQSSTPALWSEFRLSMPQFLNYVFLMQGYHPFTVKDKKDRTTVFNIRESNGTGPTESYSFTSGVTDYRWAIQNVPALKKESFTSTIDNHTSKIEFQLASYQYPLTPKDFMGSWPGLTKELLESEYFGAQIKGANTWVADVVKPVVSVATGNMDKAKKIFNYVRDNTTCTDHSSVYTDNTLKSLLKTKAGSVSEINLLLTAMLRYAGFTAEPIILSTSEHGYAYAMYPLLNKFNYVICRVEVEGKTYYLDASQPRLGFGKLTPECYNGHARVVNEMATPLELVADSLHERKLTSIFIGNNEQGKWVGSMKQQSGYYESYSIRNKVKEQGEEAFFKEVKKAFGLDITIHKPAIDSLTNYDVPVQMNYNFSINNEEEDILYINPMFGEGYKENPFKSAERVYPVEMPYAMDETYILSMEIPKGYVVDELPKQLAVKLNELGEGYFEYLVTASGNTISMRSRLKLSRANFEPDEYEMLREFFKLVVSKHGEQIVFKKKK